MKKTIIILTVILLATTNLFSEIEFYEKNSFHFRLSFSYFNTGSYYDKEGDLISRQTDTSRESAPDYTFELSNISVQTFIEYSFTDDISAYFHLPLSYYKLKETYLNDTVTGGSREPRADFSLFQPSFFAIGGKYRLSDDDFMPYAIAEFRIPPGFHQGILDDPDYPFLSDGAFEFLGTIGSNLGFKESWLEASVTYNYRAEELRDQLIFYLEGGLKTVPGTRLGVFGTYFQSLGDMDDAPDFNPRMTIIQQDLLQVGAFFDIYFFENFYSKFEYHVNLYGRNTYTGGTFYVRAGIIL